MKLTDKEWKALVDKAYEVSSAHLHQSITVPGAIGAEKTINDTKIKGIQLWWSPIGLLFEAKGKRGVIPAANCDSAVFEVEAEKLTKVV